MKFKDLHIGDTFEFNHNGLPQCHGMARGPWVKESARKYVLDTNPFSMDPIERQRHYENVGLVNQVGSINVAVHLIGDGHKE